MKAPSFEAQDEEPKSSVHEVMYWNMMYPPAQDSELVTHNQNFYQVEYGLVTLSVTLWDASLEPRCG